MNDGDLCQLLADGHAALIHASEPERRAQHRDLVLALEQLLIERSRLRSCLDGLWRSMDVVPQDTRAMNAALTRLRHLHPPKETTDASPTQTAVTGGS